MKLNQQTYSLILTKHSIDDKYYLG